MTKNQDRPIGEEIINQQKEVRGQKYAALQNMSMQYTNQTHNSYHLLSGNDNYNEDLEQKAHAEIDANQTCRSSVKERAKEQHQEGEEKEQHNAETIEMSIIDAVIEERKIQY